MGSGGKNASFFWPYSEAYLPKVILQFEQYTKKGASLEAPSLIYAGTFLYYFNFFFTATSWKASTTSPSLMSL